ncbi:ABC transporter ATP-binding protein [Leptonema illini]|uniref:ABC transporter related protein n=1 Tax=Leptonema illini DSM 21528 TaxID=929563 RepID=H2CD63_9LEPT|nr:ABC transporter ATP-binding protein [Leptonema illini]EHQ07539.1 ABC transporter related protein [Leptonema illini DSM 21528]
MSDTIIKIDGLWKRYGLPPTAGPRQILSNLRHLRNPLWTDSDQGPWSLRDISLEINRGEVFGIIGRNGAGKSTLLKILAGVSKPTRGSVEVKGRIFPMIELNAGMHFDLSGRENVRLLGAVMGLTKRQIRMIEPDVEEFCELGEYFDMPVRTYSSGMLARLGFGVAMNIRADILLVDEVLSVGDYVFQKKAIDRMNRLINSGVSVMLVSHSPYVLERMCSRSILMNTGQIKMTGSTDQVLEKYFAETQRGQLSQPVADSIGKRPGSGEIRVRRIFINEGKPISTNGPMSIEFEMVVLEAAECPNIGVSIVDSYGTVIAYLTNIISKPEEKWKSGGKKVRIDVPVCTLMAGTYVLDVVVSAAAYKIDIVNNAATILVDSPATVKKSTAGLGKCFFTTEWGYADA